MKALFFVFLFAVVVLPVRAQSSDPFTEGNRAFAEERYDDAAQSYEAVIAERGYSAPTLYNLANAYYRAGRIGPAIFNYERARLLAPRDPDIVANLRLVREKASLPRLGDRGFERLSRALTPDEWAWLGTAFFLLGGAGLFLACYAERLPTTLSRAPWRLMNGMAFGIVIVAAVSALDWNTALHQAIVLAPNAPARISPFDTAETGFPLTEGSAVTITGSHGDYLLIRTAEGRSGWLRRDQAGVLLPGKTG